MAIKPLLQHSAAAFEGYSNTFGPVVRLADLHAGDFYGSMMPDLSPAEVLSSAVRFRPLEWLNTFESVHPTGMRCMRLCGVYPLPETVPAKKGKDATQTLSPLFNVGHHSVAVAVCAHILSYMLSSRGALSFEESQALTLKALLHDCNKPLEITAEIEVEPGDSAKMVLLARYERELKRLARLGVSEKVIGMAREAWLDTGHYSVRKFLLVEKDRSVRLIKGQLAAKILHLADMMVFTSLPLSPRPEELFTAILTPWERVVASFARTRRPWLFERGYGINSSGRVASMRRAAQSSAGVMALGTYAELHVLVAALIAEELKGLIEPEAREPAHLWAKRVIQRKLAYADAGSYAAKPQQPEQR